MNRQLTYQNVTKISAVTGCSGKAIKQPQLEQHPAYFCIFKLKIDRDFKVQKQKVTNITQPWKSRPLNTNTWDI